MKRCFYVSRIGAEDSTERKTSDKLLEHIIIPVCTDMGYSTPERADHIAASGIITTQVFTRLLEDDLVIADLTGANPNVFYELAVRHMVRKPFVQFIQKGEKIPFDIALNRTLHYDFDIATVEKCKKDLRLMIDWFAHDSQACDTALSLAIDFKELNPGGGKGRTPDLHRHPAPPHPTLPFYLQTKLNVKEHLPMRVSNALLIAHFRRNRST